MIIAKKKDPAFLCSTALKKPGEDSFVRYTPTSSNGEGF
jgi:hypothetical protein